MEPARMVGRDCTEHSTDTDCMQQQQIERIEQRGSSCIERQDSMSIERRDQGTRRQLVVEKRQVGFEEE